MTERGLPIVDGAPACPFVAFEDDRDERASSPDHRHRCYAEPQPAPRALAHQEAYCLSSAFPVCPTFQDWARREAARSRADRPQPAEPLAGAASLDASQRNPPRNWAAPPPWLSGRGGTDAAGPGDAAWADEEGDEEDEFIPAARGLSGSYADKVASDTAAPTPSAAGATPSSGAGGTSSRGVTPEPGADEAAWPSAASARNGDDARWDEELPDGAVEPPARLRRRERDASGVAAFAAAGGGQQGGPPERRSGERRRDSSAPEWERSRPLEAYPTLRSRRLPDLSVPPILVGVVAVALAAAVLFALPGLLGFGNPSSVGSPTPTAGSSSAPASLAPTAVPAATPQIYIVQAGDTMSRIAGRFGITLADLIAANQQTIPNPDSLQIGQEVTIPVPLPSELPAASVIPAAS